MSSKYNQLTQDERYQIQALHGLFQSARAIGKVLHRSNKTISRELRRLKSGAYHAKQAQEDAHYKRHHAKKANKLNAANQAILDRALHLYFSPEQSAGRARLEKIEGAPSRSTLYRWIGRLGWRNRLPRKGKIRRQHKGQASGVKLIPNRVDIDQRPQVVSENTELGHWEGDTLHGKEAYLVTLVERTTKTLLMAKVPNKSKRTVGQAIERLLKPFARLCKTITFDNGGEFADHQRFAKKLKCKVYFAKPYHSWERGLNENTNGLVRRFFPKTMNFSGLSKKEVDQAQFLINHRPRKTLGYRTPIEALAGRTVSLMMGI